MIVYVVAASFLAVIGVFVYIALQALNVKGYE